MSDPTEIFTRWITEAFELRANACLPPPQAAIADILDRLRHTRAALDRVEELLTQAIRARTVLTQARDNAHHTYQDAWDAAATDLRNRPVRRAADEYSTAKERHAEANLATLDLRNTLSLETHRLRRAEQTVEILRLNHRGLDGLRQDTLTVLRAMQVETTLER